MKMLFGRQIAEDATTVDSMLAKRSFGDLSAEKEATNCSETQEPSMTMIPAPKRKELKIEKVTLSKAELKYLCEYRLGKLSKFGGVGLDNIQHHLYFNRCKRLIFEKNFFV